VVTTPEDDHYCVYHAHTDYNNPSGDRQVYITPLTFVDGKICVKHPIISGNK
jgi:hypothetical protein